MPSVDLLHTPRGFQAEGVSWLREQERAILGDDPGLGKTGQAILAASEPVLVIAPAALEGTWREEVASWRPDLVYDFTSYSGLCRRKADAAGRLSVVEPFPRPEYKGQWGTVICDEAHYLKGRKTGWSKAVNCLSADRLYLLTGTPLPNWAHEIFMLLRILHRGDRRFSSYWKWAERWFVVWEPAFGGRKIGRLKREFTWVDFAQGNGLDEAMLRRLRDDVLKDLPPLTVHPPTLCPMVPKQRRAYNELQRDYLTYVDGIGEITAWSDGAKFAKMCQVATGLETLTDGEAMGSGKLDRLALDLEDRAASPTLVGVHYRSTARAVYRLCERMKRSCAIVMGGMPSRELDRARVAFQRGDLQVLVGTLDKMSEGLTLHRADTAIQVERSWKPYRNDQFARRIHRMGQTRPTNLITYHTPDSTDDVREATLAEKTAEQVDALTAQELARRIRASLAAA